MPEHARHFFKSVAEKQLFRNQQHAEKKPPCDEVPTCAVPESGQTPDDEDVADLLPCACAAAAKRDVNIIPEPGAERYMPAPPKFGGALRNERIIEVFREMEAKHHPKANCHVRIPGKVKVNLQAERRSIPPTSEHARFRGFKRGAELAEEIRQQYLFTEANGKTQCAAAHGLC